MELHNSSICEEVDALFAILLDSIEVEKNESGLPILVRSTVYPATAEDAVTQYVCTNLEITLPDGYPEESPSIRLTNSRGLSELVIKQIEEACARRCDDFKGSPILYELFELVKEFLTGSNRPAGDCPICLFGFHVDDDYVHTDCYHHFHKHCLYRYVISTKAAWEEEEADLRSRGPLHHMTRDDRKLLCPMCRLEIKVEESSLASAPPPVEYMQAPDSYISSNDVVNLQKQMESLYLTQKSKGAIIDPSDEAAVLVLHDLTTNSLDIPSTSRDSAAPISDGMLIATPLVEQVGKHYPKGLNIKSRKHRDGGDYNRNYGKHHNGKFHPRGDMGGENTDRGNHFPHESDQKGYPDRRTHDRRPRAHNDSHWRPDGGSSSRSEGSGGREANRSVGKRPDANGREQARVQDPTGHYVGKGPEAIGCEQTKAKFNGHGPDNETGERSRSGMDRSYQQTRSKNQRRGPGVESGAVIQGEKGASGSSADVANVRTGVKEEESSHGSWNNHDRPHSGTENYVNCPQRRTDDNERRTYDSSRRPYLPRTQGKQWAPNDPKAQQTPEDSDNYGRAAYRPPYDNRPNRRVYEKPHYRGKPTSEKLVKNSQGCDGSVKDSSNRAGISVVAKSLAPPGFEVPPARPPPGFEKQE